MSKEAASSENLFGDVLKQQQAAAPIQNQEPTNPETPSVDEQAPQKSEEELKAEHLARLKERATLMGIKFSGNIGIEALKAKIEAKLNNEAETENQDSDEATEQGNGGADTQDPASTSAVAQPAAKPKSFRQELFDREMKLVRLRITNLDPKKKDLPGEIFTFANSVLGTVRKYIPYGEATDNGYHVPYCIYKQLRDREFVNIRTRKDRQGRINVSTGMAREFALEILPPLTPEEIAKLAAQQAASAGLD